MFKQYQNINFIIFLFFSNFYISSCFSLILHYEGSFISILFKFFLVFLFMVSILFSIRKIHFSKLQIFILFILLLYSFRLFIDFQINSLNSLMGNYNYYINIILLGILPIFSLSSFNKDTSLNGIYFKFLFLIILVHIYFAFFQIDLNYSGRLANVKLNPISLGYISATGIYIIISRILNFKHLFFLFFFIFFCIIIFLTQSRGNQLALLVTLTLTQYFRISFKKNIIFLILILLFSSLFVYFTNFDFEVFSYIGNVGSEKDLSGTYRIEILNESFKSFKNNILFGSSVLTYDGGYHHNVFLELFNAIGFISFFLVFVLFFNFIKLFNKIKLFSNFDYFIFLNLIHGFILSLFSSSFSEIGILFFIFLFLYNKYVLKFNEKRYNNNIFFKKVI